VHRLAGEGDRDLGAGEVLHAVRVGRGGGAVLAADFVVVGQRPQFDAVGGGTRRQVLRRQRAVGNHGVAVQVGVEDAARPVTGTVAALAQAPAGPGRRNSRSAPRREAAPGSAKRGGPSVEHAAWAATA
jgi:hypothetical protein